MAQDPIITLHPTSQTVLEGADAFMWVQATSTNGPMTYQWQRDDPAAPMTFTNIPNAMRGRLDLRNVTLDDTGDYRAVVFNASGDSANLAHFQRPLDTLKQTRSVTDPTQLGKRRPTKGTAPAQQLVQHRPATEQVRTWIQRLPAP